MSKSFSLIEVLVIIAVIAILVGLSSLNLVSFGRASEVDAGRVEVVQALREAQSNSMANLGANPWGVHFESAKVVIFQDGGAGFDPNDSQNNRVKIMPKGISLSWIFTGGGDNLMFEKGTGQTLNSGTVTVSGNTSIEIKINKEGMIDW